MAFAAPAQLFAYPNAAIESMIQWYVPSLDVVEIFRCLMIVTDRNSELEALSTETAEVFGQLEDDCKWRVELCADGRARRAPREGGGVGAAPRSEQLSALQESELHDRLPDGRHRSRRARRGLHS